jgi:hypothetical protein
MKSFLTNLLVVSSLFTFSKALPTAPLRQVIAGISVIDTPIVRDAMLFARKYGDDMTYNHVVRSWLFGSAIIASNAQYNTTVDQEVHAVAALLHDVSWDVKLGIVSPDKRFEVDGAIAARDFIRNHTDGRKWDERRVQLIWDSIALHSEHGISNYKELEVRVVSEGVGADFMGEGVEKEVYKAVFEKYPGLDLMNGARDKIVGLCREKPISSYGE